MGCVYATPYPHRGLFIYATGNKIQLFMRQRLTLWYYRNIIMILITRGVIEMSEFNIEDLDEVISTVESSLVQILALQLKKTIRQQESSERKISSLIALAEHTGWVMWLGGGQPVSSDLWVETFWEGGEHILHKARYPEWGNKKLLAYRLVKSLY